MAFELRTDEPVPAGIRRIVGEQVDAAVDELSGRTDDSHDEAVHSARKRLKRIRAVLRLVRAEIGDEVYARENADFRDTARLLASVRDAAVLVETLDGLPAPDGTELGDLRESLVARYERLRTEHEGDGGREEALERLAAAWERIADWPLRWDGFVALEGGLRRVYRQGRERMEAAAEDPTPERWHEWRKRVKDLWHHHQILEGVWPPVFAVLADECHRLSDFLGDEHDLTVLQSTVREEGLADEATAACVADLVERRRGELRDAALPLGSMLYAEPPSAFVARMGAYWEASREGA